MGGGSAEGFQPGRHKGNTNNTNKTKKTKTKKNRGHGKKKCMQHPVLKKMLFKL